MMVLRVDPASERASLLSLPRDLWVPLASGGNQRINSAIQNGGPSELIDTIEQYLGIPIHHYVQVDFAGFQELVDVIDGVRRVLPGPGPRHPTPASTSTTPGCVTLDGQQALAYVRSRHFQYYEDGRWRSDPSGDLGRISRQQDFIVRALHRAVDQGVRNPLTLDRLVDAGLATVTVDDLLTADDIIDLGARLPELRPGSLDTYALPRRAGHGGRRVDPAPAGRGGPAHPRPLPWHRPRATCDRATCGCWCSTAPGSPARRRRPATALDGGRVRRGGHRARPSASTSPRPLVRYTAGNEAKADLVARYLDPSARLELVEGAARRRRRGGHRHRSPGVRAEPRPPGPSTTATTDHDHRPPRRRPRPTSSTSTTSTTVVGYVPEAPGASTAEPRAAGPSGDRARLAPAMDACRCSADGARPGPEAAR